MWSIFNKKARLNYRILETFEAGIALTGPEVKSIRDGKVSLDGAHVQFGIGSPRFTVNHSPFTTLEAYLVGLHTAPYLPAGQSATATRALPRSPTYTLPWKSVAIECGVLNWRLPLPRVPTALTNRPLLSNFTTRVFV